MIIKKLGLLLGLFIISCIIIFSTNTDLSSYSFYDSTPVESFNIDTGSQIQISFVDNSEKNNASLIKVIETETLTDQLKIYKSNLYSSKQKEATFSIEDNKMMIDIPVGPVSIYQSVNFLTCAQFNTDYFKNIPYAKYEIHIPERTDYQLK